MIRWTYAVQLFKRFFWELFLAARVMVVICLRNHEDATADKEGKNNNGCGKDHLPSKYSDLCWLSYVIEGICCNWDKVWLNTEQSWIMSTFFPSKLYCFRCALQNLIVEYKEWFWSARKKILSMIGLQRPLIEKLRDTFFKFHQQLHLETHALSSLMINLQSDIMGWWKFNQSMIWQNYDCRVITLKQMNLVHLLANYGDLIAILIKESTKRLWEYS